MTETKNPFSIWLILDLFVNILTMLAVVTILAKSFSGIWLTFMIILFILWAFRPIYLALKDSLKDFKLPSKKSKPLKINSKKVMSNIFWITTGMGLVLYINRAFITILPNTELRVLIDHIVGGFLVTIWFYILFLGLMSFFQPNRKIDYNKKFFALSSLVVVFMIFLWEGYMQSFQNISQIVADLFGLTLSWVYFIIFRKLNRRTSKNVKNQQEEGKENKK